MSKRSVDLDRFLKYIGSRKEEFHSEMESSLTENDASAEQEYGEFAEGVRSSVLSPGAEFLLPPTEHLPVEVRPHLLAFHHFWLRALLRTLTVARNASEFRELVDLDGYTLSPEMSRSVSSFTSFTQRALATANQLFPAFVREMNEAVHRCLEKIDHELATMESNSIRNLSLLERDLVALCAAASESLDMGFRVRGCNPSDHCRNSTVSEVRKVLSRLHPRTAVEEVLRPDASIFRSGILEADIGDLIVNSWDNVDISPARLGSSSRAPWKRGRGRSLSETIEPEVSLDEVVLPEEDRENLRALCREYQRRKAARQRASLTILLQGPAGTGKTLTALAIARELGMKAFRLVLEGATSGSFPDLLGYIAGREGAQQSVLLFDEADAVLSGNRFVGTTDAKTKVAFEDFEGVAIFTTNEMHLAEPIHRRMNYTMEFSDPTPEARLLVLRREVDRVCRESNLQKAPSTEELERLSAEYQTSGGFIAQAMMLAVAKSPVGELSTSALESSLRQIAERQGHVRRKDEARAPRTSLSQVKLDSSAQEEITRFVAYARRGIAAASDFAPTLPGGVLPGPTLLLSGPPGTGKTLTAEAIARELGLQFRRISPSTIESPYVGEFQLNVARLFRHAEKRGYLLMIDEAEGIFTSREGATRSWEVSRADELLQQVEAFRGVLVIATNHSKMIDQAFARRFLFHVALQLPSVSTRVELWRQWQLSLALTDGEVQELASRHELSGGEIRNVAIRGLTRGRTSVSELSEICAQVARDRTGTRQSKVGF